MTIELPVVDARRERTAGVRRVMGPDCSIGRSALRGSLAFSALNAAAAESPVAASCASQQQDCDDDE
jgi:hypothetical protein